ncbi:MAG: aldo/keto reductase [Pseudohongiellaceae bacterium]|nr:aldo/keto reductase [Pseudohongiellaceae bacterium]
MKLALGTVQLGMNYGVANDKGQVGEQTAFNILQTAQSLNIDTLDTARAYGTSEDILGKFNLKNFKIVSKLPSKPIGVNGLSSWVLDTFQETLVSLNVESIYGFLLHRPLELLEPDGIQIYEALADLKKSGRVTKIGLSISNPKELETLLDRFDFDIIQSPLNILDRRLETSGWLRRLSSEGVEIHVRSAFLQGLLLMGAHDRPGYFSTWSILLEEIKSWCKDNQLTLLEACFAYLNQFKEIDKIVVGVQTPEQLQELACAYQVHPIRVPINMQSDDPMLINPANWNI